MIKYYIGIFFISLLVLGAIVYGFMSGGSPLQIRGQKFDTQRVTDITNLKYSIDNYYSVNGKLPLMLSDIKNLNAYNTSTNKDPETKKEYEYKTTGTQKYQLCATFSYANDKTSKNRKSSLSYYSYTNNEYLHPKGYHCFDLTVK